MLTQSGLVRVVVICTACASCRQFEFVTHLQREDYVTVNAIKLHSIWSVEVHIPKAPVNFTRINISLMFRIER